MPLESGTLREIRVYTGGQSPGTKVVHAAIFMQAQKDRNDPRRLLVFQDVRRKRLVREPFALRKITQRKEQVVNYITPQRRYTYRRVKDLGD